MYYPFFRGKQFELILLREMASLLSENPIYPIIEPVKDDFSALKKTMDALNNVNTSYSVILNPQVGNNPVPESNIKNLLTEGHYSRIENLTIGYTLYPNSDINDLKSVLNELSDYHFLIIHQGYSNGKLLAQEIANFTNIKSHIFIEGFAGKLYQKHLKKDGITRILIRNGFKPREKNALYPKNEHFSDLHITFPEEGMDGFGDYLIVGDDYSESGGPAYAVAIHLTYLDNDDDMYIYHFISDQTSSPTDPGGKFLEALEKLVKAVRNPRSLIFKSEAVNEYVELFEKQHYPGLGYVKKLSMRHHIELIADYIRRTS
jgi:hypothetical protein